MSSPQNASTRCGSSALAAATTRSGNSPSFFKSARSAGGGSFARGAAAAGPSEGRPPPPGRLRGCGPRAVEGLPRLAGALQDLRAARVAVLEVEHRVVARLLLDEPEVEIELRVRRLREEHEAAGVGADVVDEIRELVDGALALAHLH